MLWRSVMPLRFIRVVVVALGPCYRRSGRTDGGFQRYGSVEAVSSAQHGLDQSAVRITELITQERDALHKRIVRHENVGPYRFDKLIFGNKPPSILGKIAQYFECLWRQSDLLISVSQTSTRQIERKTIETEHSRRKRTHPLRLPGYTHRRNIGLSSSCHQDVDSPSALLIDPGQIALSSREKR